MTTVVQPRITSRISVASGASSSAAIIARSGAAVSTLQSIANVDATALSEGDTLVYDNITNKWVAKPIPALDGGTY